MIEDHIMDGDFVVCEQTQVANAGDIVVALIGGEEATLKRFYREGAGKIRLQPANSEMAPIMVAANDVKIQGRVIGVLRSTSPESSNCSPRQPSPERFWSFSSFR